MSHKWNPPFPQVKPDDRQQNLDSLVQYLDVIETTAAGGGAAGASVWALAGPDATRSLDFINSDHYHLPLDAPAGTQQYTGGGSGEVYGDSGGWTTKKVQGTDAADSVLVVPEAGYYAFGVTIPHFYLGDGGQGLPSGGSQFADGEMFETALYTTTGTGAAIFSWYLENVTFKEMYQGSGNRGSVPSVNLSGFAYFDPDAADYEAPNGIGFYLDFSGALPTSIQYAVSAFQLMPILWAYKVVALEASPAAGATSYGAKVQCSGAVSVAANGETNVTCNVVVNDPEGLSDGTGFTVTEDGIYIMVGSFTVNSIAANKQAQALVRDGSGSPIYGMTDHYNDSGSTARLACNITAGAYLLAGTSVRLRFFCEDAASLMVGTTESQNQNDYPQFTIAKVG